MMRVDASELNRLAVALDGAAGRVGAEVARFTREKAHDVETTAKQLVPVKSGTLKRSIHVEMSGDGRHAGLRAEIGSDVEYARRIELGFEGADSLGRVYSQAPRAYLGPAYDRHVPDYVTGLARIAGESMFR